MRGVGRIAVRTKWQSGTAILVTARHSTERETASIGDERCAVGKTNPYLSRKIYFRGRPVQ